MENRKCGRYLAEYLRKVYDRVSELESCEMPEITRDSYMEFFINGNRLNYEKLYFARREFLTVYGLAAVLWGEFSSELTQRCANRLLLIIEDILGEPTWVLPAHGSAECFDGKSQVIDLFSAETAGSVGEILYLLQDFPYGEQERKQLKAVEARYIELCGDRILKVFEAKNPCDWWETADMNWNAVCSANVGMAAYYSSKLAPGTISPQRMQAIQERIAKALAVYIRPIEETGICKEGALYYQYGMQYFLAAYELFSGVESDPAFSFDFPKTAEFLSKTYIGNGNYVCFSDSSSFMKLNMGIQSYLSSLFPKLAISTDYMDNDVLLFNEDLMEFLGGAECHRWAGAYRDYIWVKRYGNYLTPASPMKKNCSFEKAQWYILWPDDATCVPIKGGNNDESHNHNDIGSFSYWNNGTEYLCDLGSGEYCRDYFSEKRYEILCCSSRGHNVPILDGLLQKAGAEYQCAGWRVGARSLEMELGLAYGRKSDELIRKFSWNAGDGGRSVLKIIDCFLGEKLCEVFVTRISPAIKGSRVFLTSGSGQVVVETENPNLRWNVEAVSHRNHEGNDERVYLLKGEYAPDAAERKEITVSITSTVLPDAF